MYTDTSSNLKSKLVTSFFILVSLCISNFVSVGAQAGSHSEGKGVELENGIKISDSWARATFALAKTGAAYMTISNHSNKDITLLSVDALNDIASMTEIHHTVMNGDMMKMQELEDGVEIKAGQTLELKPGGIHIMLMGLSGPLNAGEDLQLKLSFSDNTSATQTFNILDMSGAQSKSKKAMDSSHKGH